MYIILNGFLDSIHYTLAKEHYLSLHCFSSSNHCMYQTYRFFISQNFFNVFFVLNVICFEWKYSVKRNNMLNIQLKEQYYFHYKTKHEPQKAQLNVKQLRVKTSERRVYTE